MMRKRMATLAAAVLGAGALTTGGLALDDARVAVANQFLASKGLPAIDKVEQRRANCHNGFDLLVGEMTRKKAIADSEGRWAQAYEAARRANQPCPVPPESLLARANGHVIQSDDAMATIAGFVSGQEDPVAMFEVGLAFFNGKFGQSSVQEGYELIAKAAKLGDPEALYTQGVLIARGQIDSKADLKGGLALVEASARSGHVDALFAAGNFFRSGSGTKKDLKRAFDYYRQAAERGHFYATFLAWNMLTEGEGVKKDFDLAYRLSRTLAADGHVYGAVMATSALLQTKDPARHQDEILYWLDAAIRNGDADVRGKMTPLRAQVVQLFSRPAAPVGYQPRPFKACPMKAVCTVNHYSGLRSCTTNKDFWSDCDG